MTSDDLTDTRRQGVDDMTTAGTDRPHRFDPIVAALAQMVRERHAMEQDARDRRLELRVLPQHGGLTN